MTISSNDTIRVQKTINIEDNSAKVLQVYLHMYSILLHTFTSETRTLALLHEASHTTTEASHTTTEAAQRNDTSQLLNLMLCKMWAEISLYEYNYSFSEYTKYQTIASYNKAM